MNKAKTKTKTTPVAVPAPVSDELLKLDPATIKMPAGFDKVVLTGTLSYNVYERRRNILQMINKRE